VLILKAVNYSIEVILSVSGVKGCPDLELTV